VLTAVPADLLADLPANMKAMALSRPAPVEDAPLHPVTLPVPRPAADEVLIRVECCAVCRTDLHVVEGELPPRRDRVVPGHQVVGRVSRRGSRAERFPVGARVGVAWLHRTCGTCAYCRRGDENLCEHPAFTGYDVDGGFAEYVAAPEAFLYPVPEEVPAEQITPLLCAGIIGYRALRRSEVRPGEPLGLYGFGASAHIVIQIARHWGCDVYVCTRGGRHADLARELGARWVGPAEEPVPVPLRSAILFAPAGELVPPALAALDRGGTLALAGIYLSDIPPLNYERHLFFERNLRSVTANTREDGRALLRLAAEVPLVTHVEEFPLEAVNEALCRLKHDQIRGAAVLRICG
jgi:alcohol dehydrogenase, propanol-preferring